MAGGNHAKGSSNKASASSSSSNRKSRWESGTKSPADKKSSAPAEPKPQAPPPLPPKSKPSSNPKDNPSPSHPKPQFHPDPNPQSGPGPSPSGLPFPDALGPPPPPAYGFHMLDRRTIVLADGNVRSYFALPPDYQDFTPPPRPDPMGRFLPHGGEFPGQGFGFDRQLPRGGPMSPEFRDRDDHLMRNRNQDYWNSLGFHGRGGPEGSENLLKRKYGDEDERARREEREGNDVKDDFARQRQQLLQYGNVGSNLHPNGYRGEFMAGTSSPYRRDGVGMVRGEEMRMAKYMKSDGGYESLQGRHGGVGGNIGGLKHNEADQGALKKAFLHFAKLINENGTQKNNYLADGKHGPLQCVACGRSSNDFQDMHGLIIHTYNSDNTDLHVDHLGLHKALCILMGWNYMMPPDNSKSYRLLSADEAAANQDDLIMWPPVVIIQNTITGKGRDSRMEGLGNKAVDNKLRDLGFNGGKSKSLYGREGHMGVTLVKYAGDQAGLMEAVRLAEFFEKDSHGRQSWAVIQSLTLSKDHDKNPNLVKVDKKTGERERIFYGYLGTISDLETVDFETRKKVVIVSRREYKASK